MQQDKQQTNVNIGARIRNLRLRGNYSLRQLSQMSGVSVSYLSSIEKDLVSPTLAMLRKVLVALGTNFSEFFSDSKDNDSKYVFRKSKMQMAADHDREYTFIFPRRPNIHLDMMDEVYIPGAKLPEFETLEHDFAGYVISGEIVLDVGEEPSVHLQSGDAFYVPRGIRIRGYCEAGQQARLLTVMPNRVQGDNPAAPVAKSPRRTAPRHRKP
ncbi:MAG: helix-turn-helix domain-containing protein [Victivallales bacterium]|nr:helix-turn-helix domain-containing protein [Victivallales bacterium]